MVIVISKTEVGVVEEVVLRAIFDSLPQNFCIIAFWEEEVGVDYLC